VMLRLIDIVLAALGLVVCFPIVLVLLFVGTLDTGSPLFMQIRVGRYQRGFTLIKFRTMKVETKSIASHLANPADVTPIGSFLRRTKLDELPQLWNVLLGDMSMVGPRPCLFNQTELIHEREIRGIFEVRPGVTGLAQTLGIDMSTPKLLAETDAKMLSVLSLSTYLRYIFQTLTGSGRGDRIRIK
jgi:O-antigen biosynthesis protein WbqP